MRLEDAYELKDINLVQFLGAVKYHVKLDKEFWNRQQCTQIIREGFNKLLCTEIGCNNNVIKIDTINSKAYCESHSSLMDSNNYTISNVEQVWIDINKIFSKLERHLIVLQERVSFIKTNSLPSRLNEDDQKELDKEVYSKIHLKVYHIALKQHLQNLNSCIQNFRNKGNIAGLLSIHQFYNKIKCHMLEICKMIYISLFTMNMKLITAALAEEFQDYELEENKGEPRPSLCPEIYENQIDLLTISSLSMKKIK